MKVRLKKDAPWESVISPDGQTIDKINWLNETTDIRPFTKHIDFLIEESDIDYDLPIENLISIAEKNNINTNMTSREELIKRLKDFKVKMPHIKKIDYKNLSKQELVLLAESKNIEVKGLSKNKLIEILENV